MTWTLIAHAIAQAADNPTTADIDTTGADLIVISCLEYAFSSSGNPLAPNDNKGNSFSQKTNNVGGQDGCIFYVCEAPTVGSGHHFSIPFTSVFGTIIVEAWSGSKGVGSFFSESGNNSSSAASMQPGALLPPQDGCLLVSSQATDDTATLTIDSGFAISDQQGTSGRINGGMAYLIQGSAALENPTWTWTVNANSADNMAVFLPGGGGGPEVPLMGQIWM